MKENSCKLQKLVSICKYVCSNKHTDINIVNALAIRNLVMS